MFRELLRIKQKISDKECLEILLKEKRGVLSLQGEDGYPYAIPLDYYYDEESGKIFFHCGKTGYKLDCLAKSDKICFTVVEEGVREEGNWWLTVRSLVIFGRAEIIKEDKTIREISEKLSRKFTSDDEYISREIEKYAPATFLLALTPEHICGKRVREK